MFTYSVVLALVGLSISLYSYVIEKKIKQDSSYKPLCDFSDTFSCSAVVRSKYSNILGISNAVVGIAFYLVVLEAALQERTLLLQLLAASSVVASVGLAYILYAKVKSACTVCLAIYGVNGLMLVTSYYQL